MRIFMYTIALLFFLTPILVASAEESIDVNRIDQYFEQKLKESKLPGAAVSITKDGKTLYQQTYGEGFNNGDPLEPDTLMYIGSVSKPITATAVMQLVEKGEIQLDTPVNEVLPYFTVGEDPKSTGLITVQHLLSHRSGISTYNGMKNVLSNRDKTIEEAIRHDMKDLNLFAKPGETFQYSNLNYIILGAIIEEVSDQSYHDYVKKNIFEPLNMSNTYTRDPKELGLEVADGHQYFFGFVKTKDTVHNRSSVPAGFIVTTTEDLSRFASAHAKRGHL